VPSVGVFFTPLPLEDAFVYQDQRRFISSRRFVAPSFNDIRLILNTAQIIGLVRERRIQLVTFDGDVTLYDDGESLRSSNPVIPRIIKLLMSGTKVGIVTAAGYTDASRYYERLHGLLDAINGAIFHGDIENPELVVLGGESNYLFRFNKACHQLLKYIPREQWMLEEMKLWTEEDVTELLDVAVGALRECIANMHLQAEILRKERAVGIVPTAGGQKMTREQLEETVLVTQQILEMSDVGKRLPFCAFNGTSISITFPSSLQNASIVFHPPNTLFPPASSKSPPKTSALTDQTCHLQEATTSSSTSATNPGVCSPANASSAASKVAELSTSAINSCRLEPTTSR